MLAVIDMDLDNVRTAAHWGINHQPQLFNQLVGIVLWYFYDARTLYLEGELIFGLIATKLKSDLNQNQPNIESGVILPEHILWAQYNTAFGGTKTLLGRPQEAEPILQKSLLMLPARDPATHWARAYCLAFLGATAYYNGDHPQAISYLKESGALWQATGDMWLFAIVLWLQGMVELALGDYDESQRLVEESERLLSQIGDQKFIGALLNHLARLALYRGDIVKAETYGQAALTQQTRVGSISDITESLNDLGEAAYLKGEYRKAQAYHEQCLQMVTEINMSLRVERTLWNLGNLAVAESDFELAKQYFAQADFTRNVNQGLIGGPGWAALGLGELAEARHYFQSGLQAMLQSGAKLVGLDALVGMANLKLRNNQFSRALELLALVRHHRASNWEVQEKVRKLWEELVAELRPELVAEAEAQGRELDLWETANLLLAEEKDG